MISFDSEKDMEDFLIGNEDFVKEIFELPEHTLYRQARLGKYGIADIVAVKCIEYDEGHRYVDVVIIELKNTSITHSHISQVARYRDFFQRMYNCTEDHIEIRGKLIGLKTFPGNDDLCFLSQNIDWLEVYEIHLDPRSGISFKLIEGWHPSSHTDADGIEAYKAIVPPAINIQPRAKREANEGFD